MDSHTTLDWDKLWYVTYPYPGIQDSECGPGSAPTFLQYPPSQFNIRQDWHERPGENKKTGEPGLDNAPT